MVRQYAGLWIIGAPHFKTLARVPQCSGQNKLLSHCLYLKESNPVIE